MVCKEFLITFNFLTVSFNEPGFSSDIYSASVALGSTFSLDYPCFGITAWATCALKVMNVAEKRSRVRFIKLGELHLKIMSLKKREKYLVETSNKS